MREPSSRHSSAGNSPSSTLISCRHKTSEPQLGHDPPEGGSRRRIELAFQVVRRKHKPLYKSPLTSCHYENYWLGQAKSVMKHNGSSFVFAFSSDKLIANFCLPFSHPQVSVNS